MIANAQCATLPICIEVPDKNVQVNWFEKRRLNGTIIHFSMYAYTDDKGNWHFFEKENGDLFWYGLFETPDLVVKAELHRPNA